MGGLKIIFSAYNPDFGGKIEALRAENKLLWDVSKDN
jgi:hypothetical protein